MAEIKSTLEKVMERAASMGHATKDEMQAEELVKDGMRMAADYLKGQPLDFSSVLETSTGGDHVIKGIVQVF